MLVLVGAHLLHKHEVLFKQPLPEPWFCSPVLSQEDLDLVQMSQPKTTTSSQVSKPPANPGISLQTPMNKEKIPLPHHLLTQVNHRKKKLLSLYAIIYHGDEHQITRCTCCTTYKE